VTSCSDFRKNERAKQGTEDGEGCQVVSRQGAELSTTSRGDAARVALDEFAIIPDLQQPCARQEPIVLIELDDRDFLLLGMIADLRKCLDAAALCIDSAIENGRYPTAS
jgi:hypothetical protein